MPVKAQLQSRNTRETIRQKSQDSLDTKMELHKGPANISQKSIAIRATKKPGGRQPINNDLEFDSKKPYQRRIKERPTSATRPQ